MRINLTSPEKNYLLQKKALRSLTDAQRMAVLLWAEGANEGEISLILFSHGLLDRFGCPAPWGRVRSLIKETLATLRAEVKK